MRGFRQPNISFLSALGGILSTKQQTNDPLHKQFCSPAHPLPSCQKPGQGGNHGTEPPSPIIIPDYFSEHHLG